MARKGRGGSILCAAGVMVLTASASADCFDGVQNGPESDVDCGGDCLPCDHGNACRIARDCLSGRCADGTCEERPYRRGAPIPTGYRVEFSETDTAAIVRQIGLVSLGVGYGAAYVAALSLPGELSWMYAPVVGPFVLVADSDQSNRALIALDGGLQLVGFALIVGGLVAGGRELVRDELAPIDLGVRVTPARVGKSGYGVGVSGAF